MEASADIIFAFRGSSEWSAQGNLEYLKGTPSRHYCKLCLIHPRRKELVTKKPLCYDRNYENITECNQRKIHPFQSGSLQLKGICKRISGAYQTVRIYDQQQSRGDFRRHLQRACGCHLFFLLYLEYCVCKGINRRVKKIMSEYTDLGWRAGSLL